jgi:precorrin-3B synthase
MPSGDGLLARLRPIDTISLSGFAGLCAAARQFGNGVIEVTSRGSIQFRGLTAPSAPRFADAVAALGIAADDGIAVHSSPLAGLEARELLDADFVAGELRRALARTALTARLSPKVSVAIDGGGALGLNGLAADVRLSADLMNDAAIFHVRVGGDAAAATHLGIASPGNAVEVAWRLLDVIAQHGRIARARDVIATGGVARFHAAIADLIIDGISPSSGAGLAHRDARDAIGAQSLGDGSIACGIGLAFGHTDAGAFEKITQAARSIGALGFRTAPGRVLLAIGIRPAEAARFAAAAERLGFIARSDDPRRYVIACAGAPVCSAAHLASRSLAPAIANAVKNHLNNDFRIHISGCAKGCAHAGFAALTIVGRDDGCAVIAGGTVRDEPFAFATASGLPSVIAGWMRDVKRDAGRV